MWSPIRAATRSIVVHTNLNVAQARFVVLVVMIATLAVGLGFAEANGCACVELFRG
jgi:hypothetical protein